MMTAYYCKLIKKQRGIHFGSHFRFFNPSQSRIDIGCIPFYLTIHFSLLNLIAFFLGGGSEMAELCFEPVEESKSTERKLVTNRPF